VAAFTLPWANDKLTGSGGKSVIWVRLPGSWNNYKNNFKIFFTCLRVRVNLVYLPSSRVPRPGGCHATFRLRARTGTSVGKKGVGKKEDRTPKITGPVLFFSERSNPRGTGLLPRQDARKRGPPIALAGRHRETGPVPPTNCWRRFRAKSVPEFAPSGCGLAVYKMDVLPPHLIPEPLPPPLGPIRRWHRPGPAARIPVMACTLLTVDPGTVTHGENSPWSLRPAHAGECPEGGETAWFTWRGRGK
jgi:hypothetical protein